METHPLFTSFAILALGAIIAAAAVTACVSVEVVVYRDGRRRYRLLGCMCCLRPAVTPAVAAMGNGAVDDVRKGAPAATAAPAGSGAKPKTAAKSSKSTYQQLAGWMGGDAVAQDMLRRVT